MAKFDPKSFERQLVQQLSQLTARPFLEHLGKIASDAIRSRTRAGYGVGPGDDTGATQKRLKGLRPSTISERLRLANNGQLSSATTPRFSNLTRSGQLLDSIDIINTKKNSVIVGPKGPRSDTSLSNEKVAEYVAEQGRPFNELTQGEVRKIVNEVEAELVRIARRLT